MRLSFESGCPQGAGCSYSPKRISSQLGTAERPERRLAGRAGASGLGFETVSASGSGLPDAIASPGTAMEAVADSPFAV